MKSLTELSHSSKPAGISSPVNTCRALSLEESAISPHCLPHCLFMLRRKHMIRARFTVLSTETVTGEYLDLGHLWAGDAWLAERHRKTGFKRPAVNHEQVLPTACGLWFWDILCIRLWKKMSINTCQYHGRYRTTKLDPKEGAKRKRRKRNSWWF